MTVNITRTDVTASSLLGEAKQTNDSAAARRILAMVLILKGSSCGDAAWQCGMDDCVARTRSTGAVTLVA